MSSLSKSFQNKPQIINTSFNVSRRDGDLIAEVSSREGLTVIGYEPMRGGGSNPSPTFIDKHVIKKNWKGGE